MRSLLLSAAVVSLVACNSDGALPVGMLTDGGGGGGDASASRLTLGFAPGDVKFMFGGGVPTFATSVLGIAAADFDGDRKDDLVYGFRGPQPQGFDGGTRQESINWQASGGRSQSTAVECGSGFIQNNLPGRFDRDGKLDVITTGCPTFGRVYLGAGDGTFKPGPMLPANSPPLVAADFNEDGLDDLLVGNGFPSVVLLAVGDGTFTPKAGPFPVPTSPVARSARLDGDTHLDLLVLDNNGGGMWVLLGAGDGTFRAAGQLPKGFAVGAIGDFNGDGRTDLVSDDAIAVGVGNGMFAAPVPSGVVGINVRGAADFDRDGRLDLAGTPLQSAIGMPNFVVALGRGDGRFDAGRPFEANSGVGQDYGFDLLGVMDLNGDGKPDVYGVTLIFENQMLLTRINVSQ